MVRNHRDETVTEYVKGDALTTRENTLLENMRKHNKRQGVTDP